MLSMQSYSTQACEPGFISTNSCACYVGDPCRCDKMAFRSKHADKVLVLCYCDCSSCTCNHEDTTSQAASNPQGRRQGACCQNTVGSTATATAIPLLPTNTTLLTLESIGDSPDDLTQQWQHTAQHLLAHPDFCAEAVRFSKMQGTLQVYLDLRQQQEQTEPSSPAGSDISCSKSSSLASKLHELGLQVRARDTAAAVPEWQHKLAQPVDMAGSTSCDPRAISLHLQANQQPASTAVAVASVARRAQAAGSHVSSGGASGGGSRVAAGALRSAVFCVSGMTCSTCAATVEDVVSKVPGVHSVQVNLASNTANVVFHDALSQPESIVEAVENAGFEAGLSPDALTGDSGAGPASAVLNISGMTCSTCAAAVEDVVGKVPGVVSVSVNLASCTAKVVYDPGVTGARSCIEAVADAGFEASLASDGGGDQAEKAAAREAAVWLRRLLSALLLAIPVAVLSMLTMEPTLQQKLEGPHWATDNHISDVAAQSSSMGHTASHQMDYQGRAQPAPVAVAASGPLPAKLVGGLPILWLVQLVLATAVQFGVGKVFYSSAYYSLKHRRPNMSVLIILGTSAAYIYSIIAMILAATQPGFMGHVYFESSALIIAFVCLGKWITARAKARAGDAVRLLLGLTPKTALLVLKDRVQPEGSEDCSVKMDSANDIKTAATGSSVVGKDGRAGVVSGVVEVKEVPVELIQVHDVVKVLPGASIPADGVLLSGNTTVDESLITGESLPVTKVVGDDLIGGSVNGQGMILMRVARVGSSTLLSGIVRLVQEAQASKADMQVLADKVAAWFVPAIITLALVTFTAWIIIGYATDLLLVPGGSTGSSSSSLGGDVGSPWLLALLHAISVLVIACPCALGLATPSAAMVATGVAALHGVLIKGAAVLELAHKVGVVVFDKTGTLTQGKCTLQQVVWIHKAFQQQQQQQDADAVRGVDQHAKPAGGHHTHGSSSGSGTGAQHQLLKLLAAVESCSEHPLATAVVDHVSQQQQQQQQLVADKEANTLQGSTNAWPINTPELSVEDFQAVPGRGIKASVPAAWLQVVAAAASGGPGPGTCSDDGPNASQHSNTGSNLQHPDRVPVLIGNVAWMEEQGVSLTRSVRDCQAQLEASAGATVVLAAVGGTAVALLVIADAVKCESAGVLRALRERGVQCWMITGDSRRVAMALASKLDLPLSQVVAEATPAMKVHMIQQLRNKQRHQTRNSSEAMSASSTGGSLPLHLPSTLQKAVSCLLPGDVHHQRRSCVAMVGDGINDSPALTEADVGVAIGGGADIAAQSADIILMKDSLSDVLVALDISSKAYHRMVWNFLWAYGYNACAIPLAAGVLFPATHRLLPPWIAALAMAASSVSVICSSLLLRLYRPARDIRSVKTAAGAHVGGRQC